jgi:aminopeptidase N
MRRFPLIVATALLALPLPSLAQTTKTNLQIQGNLGYRIDAEIDPATHSIAATAQITFTPMDSLESVNFELHNALHILKASDQSGQPIENVRLQGDNVRFTPAAPLDKGVSATWTIQYEGHITGEDDGPVEGLKLAALNSNAGYLLYPARWFPVAGIFLNRFTAEMHIRVPDGFTVLGSGAVDADNKTTVNGKPGVQFNFLWSKPGFPGTLLLGKYKSFGAGNLHVYVTQANEKKASDLVQTAGQQLDFFAALYGQPESPRLNVVELPDETLPACWAPEIAAVSASRIVEKSGQRLLANTIAHQWWGSMISPQNLNDTWITNGMSRYSELLYVEDQFSRTAMNNAIQDVAAGALAYDTMPLSAISRLNPFSPEFQSMTYEKGAMIFHMLRFELGEEPFKNSLRAVIQQYADHTIRTAELEKVFEATSQQSLTPFFAQWYYGTGAPQFTSKYSVYRLGNNKGFRTIGEVGQDLDLFRMPIELRIETEGKTESQKIEISGTSSSFTIDTFGRPHKISLDPDQWLLKNTPDLQVRIHILRGQQQVAQGDTAAAIAEYQKALEANALSSLASYRLGEIFYQLHNYQSAANSYRDALRGDGEPRWTEVWCHVQLGKIFDVTGQRDRALNEYRQAIQTNDNTQGALNEARTYIQKPFVRPDTE